MPKVANSVIFVSFVLRTRQRELNSALLPAGLLYTRDLALVSELTEADPADSIFLQNGMRTAADVAAGIGSRRELWLAGLLDLHRCFCHGIFLLIYFENGMLNSFSSSRASSSVWAVVTKMMSMPLTLSTLSYSISGKISCSLMPSA